MDRSKVDALLLRRIVEILGIGIHHDTLEAEALFSRRKLTQVVYMERLTKFVVYVLKLDVKSALRGIRQLSRPARASAIDADELIAAENPPVNHGLANFALGTHAGILPLIFVFFANSKR